MGWRWSCTCKPSCSIVRSCGLLQGDIVKIKIAMHRNGYWQRVIKGITSISETKTADTIPNDWPALKVGAPHCSGYGILILWSVQNSSQEYYLKCFNWRTNFSRISKIRMWDVDSLFVLCTHRKAHDAKYSIEQHSVSAFPCTTVVKIIRDPRS
jgi:hypothetical protein